MIKNILKNQKGQQIVEVLISLFLMGFFISGLIGFYQYTGDFQEVKDFTLAERHFTFIQNLLSQNCDSFIDDVLKKESYVNHNPLNKDSKESPQITMKSSEFSDHSLLYAKEDVQGHLLYKNPNVALREIRLERGSKKRGKKWGSSIIFESFLTVKLESLKTFKEYEKTIKLYTMIDPKLDQIIDCSIKPIFPCKIEDIEIDYRWEEETSTTIINRYNCHNKLDKKELATLKKVAYLPKSNIPGGAIGYPGEIMHITDTSSPCCVCLIQLQCSEGYWSQSSSCFKRTNKCEKP